MPLTLISHFYNEEFLLPYWLRHHYPLFDHGVLLDYDSTDRSVEIIRELAPGWIVRPSANRSFDARGVDAEVMAVEREFPGWKIVLNTTEFLLCHDLPLYVRWMEKYRPDVFGIWAFDLTMVDCLAERDDEVTSAPLYFQKHRGYHSQSLRSRMLHRQSDGRYVTGRHASPVVDKVLDDGLLILWFGWCPIRYVRGRKLQIQHRIPARDRAEGLGKHHLISSEELEAAYLQEASKAYDLHTAHPVYREMIQFLARKANIELDFAEP